MSLKVLIIDDDRSVRTGLVRVLRTRGYLAASASNAEEALAAALRFRPDIIVLDLMLPGQSGTELARAIRGEPDIAGVPIIALSASPWLVAASDPLFKTVLTKPCRVNDLVQAITRAVSTDG